MKRSIAAAVVTGAALLGPIAVAAPSTAAAPAPDLVVTDVSWTAGAPSAGSPVTFSATIENRGRAATPDGVIHGVAFRTADGRTVTWSDARTRRLAPGQKVTVTANGGPAGSATWTARAGRQAVTAHVDDARRIGEADERNNTRTETVTVAAAGFRTSLQGLSPVVDAPSAAAATGVSNLLTGDGYAACHRADGTAVPGTETRFPGYTAGAQRYRADGPFAGNGDVAVPAAAGASRVVGAPISLGQVLRAHYGDPQYGMTCPAGTTGAFTRLHATSLVSHRWALDATGAPTALLASSTAALDVDLPLG